MKKRYSSLLAATGMVAFSILGFQGAAHAAWPTGCSNGKYEEGWEASCRNSNGGRYKATVTCIPDGGGKPIVRYPSVWKSRGLSIVYCPPLTFVQTGGIITKATS